MKDQLKKNIKKLYYLLRQLLHEQNKSGVMIFRYKTRLLDESIFEHL